MLWQLRFVLSDKWLHFYSLLKLHFNFLFPKYFPEFFSSFVFYSLFFSWLPKWLRSKVFENYISTDLSTAQGLFMNQRFKSSHALLVEINERV